MFLLHFKCTRSTASINKLLTKNGNAIKNSAHLRGKTFDISYRASNNNKKTNKGFIAVLNELKNKSRCYVKFERNGCLHINVMKSKKKVVNGITS
jgi:hypothetical protein